MGVLILTKDNKWEITQYHLTIPIPNNLAAELTDKIKVYESEITRDK